MTRAGAVLQIHIEAVRHTELEHRRRREREHHRVTEFGESRRRAARDGLDRVLRARPFRPIAQPHECDAGVLTAARKRKTGDSKQRLHQILLVDQEVALHVTQHAQRALLRRSGRQHNLHEHDALVFVRQKRCWKPQQQEDANGNHHARTPQASAADR